MNEEKPIKCDRKLGQCPHCNQHKELIYAFDPRVYEGGICSSCFLNGRACDLTLDDPLMRPMRFLARALQGEEPFASLLRSADSQSMDLEESIEKLKAYRDEATRQEALVNQIKAQHILKSRGFAVPLSQPVQKNHKQRRIEASIARREARKARKAALRKDRR